MGASVTNALGAIEHAVDFVAAPVDNELALADHSGLVDERRAGDDFAEMIVRVVYGSVRVPPFRLVAFFPDGNGLFLAAVGKDVEALLGESLAKAQGIRF